MESISVSTTLRVLSVLLLIADFVQCTNNSESICHKLSQISKIGRGELTITSRNYPLHHPLQECSLIPDNSTWIVDMVFNNFTCKNWRPEVRFDVISVCGDSVRFTTWFYSVNLYNNYIILDGDEQFVRVKYERPHGNYAPDFALSVPTNNIRCPTKNVKYDEDHREIKYKFKSRMTDSAIDCLFEHQGQWNVGLKFRMAESSKCSKSLFSFNKQTTVAGNGSIVIKYLRDPKITFLVETGCSVEFILTFWDWNYPYYRDLLKDTDEQPAFDGNNNNYGCPIYFTMDVPSNKCYSRTSETSLTYKEAKDWCQRQGGELPVVKTKEDLLYFIERDPLMGIFKYWLGAVRVGRTRFVWEKDHSDLNLTNWDEGEPNNFGDYSEDRIEVNMMDLGEKMKNYRHGKWNAVRHQAHNLAICQADVRETKQVETISRCPVGYYEAPNSRCYTVAKDLLTYKQAQSWCRDRGGQLPAITTEADLKYFTKAPSKLVRKCNIWLGAYLKFGNFYWERDDSPVRRNNWLAPGNDEFSMTHGSYRVIAYYLLFKNDSRNGKWLSVYDTESYECCTVCEALLSNYSKSVTNTFDAKYPWTKSTGVLIVAVTCVFVMLSLTVMVLINRQRRNQKSELSLANAYENPNLRKALTIATISDKTEKSAATSSSLSDNEINDMKKPIISKKINDCHCQRHIKLSWKSSVHIAHNG